MQMPGFKVIDKIGEGAMSVVWKARQESLDRTVAIKTLKPHVAEDPEEVRGLLKEARTAAALKHPNVVQVFDIGEAEGTPYIVMEFINGPTVGRLLEQRGRLSAKQALSIAQFVGEALAYAWDKARLVHRDIKPHNILIDSDGVVKLADLGIAKMVDAGTLSTQIRAGVLEGTPNYIAPEQAQCRENIDFRSDMYALGASLYHMVTGRMPFADLPPMQALEMQSSGHLPNPRDIAPDITVGTAQLIGRLMHKDPSRRFDSWRTAVDVIKRTMEGRMRLEGVSAYAGSTVAPPTAAGTGDAESEKPAAKPHGDGVSGLALAWTIMILLWATLAYQRLHRQPLEHIPEDAPRRVSVAPPPGERLVPPVVPRPQHTGSAPQAAPPAVPSQRPLPRPQPAPAASLNDTLQLAGRFLFAENFRAALDFVAAEARANTDPALRASLEEVGAFVAKVAAVDDDIVDAFMRHVGTEVTIVHNGQPREVFMRTVAAGKVSGTLATAEGPKPIEFMIARLNAGERNRWLGKPDTPARSAMKAILHLREGELDAAAALAPHCGPLSGLLEGEIRERRKSTVRPAPAARGGAG